MAINVKSKLIKAINKSSMFAIMCYRMNDCNNILHFIVFEDF